MTVILVKNGRVKVIGYRKRAELFGSEPLNKGGLWSGKAVVETNVLWKARESPAVGCSVSLVLVVFLQCIPANLVDALLNRARFLRVNGSCFG